MTTCIWALAALVLVYQAPAQHYTFNEISSGMDNLNVNCIVQDRSGYLWVGTENGLYRYDGRQFRRFGPGEGLRGHVIQNLFLAPDGVLFAGTTHGIYSLRQDGEFGEVHPPSGSNFFSQRIGSGFTALAPDKIVVADRAGAFLMERASPGNWTARAMHLEGTIIWSVLAAPDGSLWYGCDNDLCRLANGRTTHEGALLHLPAARWQRMLLAADGHIWLRSASHVGELIPGEGGFRYAAHDFPGELPAAPYDALVQDARGRVIASKDNAFGIWEKGHWRMVTDRNGLTRHDISALFQDRDGALWLGVLGHGLMRWVGQDRWEAFTTAEGLSDDVVWASLRDRTGRIWVGTESGLDWIPPEGDSARKWQSAGVETARAGSLAESPDGAIWMGSAAGSLVRIDERTLTAVSWKVPEVYRIKCDGARRLWIATDSGLYLIDTSRWHSGPKLVNDPAFGREEMRFSDIAVDDTGRIWTVSDGGLFRLDANAWRRLEIDSSGSGASAARLNPDTIALDRQGNIWIAGAFPGIMRLRMAGDRAVEQEAIAPPKLLSPEVVALNVDHRGWLWVGQDAGITVFDGHTWRGFTRDDGLVWNDGDSNAISQDSDGSIWIGTSGGLAHLLRPESMHVLSLKAPAVARISFGGTPVMQDAQIPWSAQPLTVSVAALNFGDAQRLVIRYRLVGLEREWVETEEEDLRYTRLDPGDYRLQVMVADKSGSAISPVTEVHFRVAPRWWQRWQLRAGLVLIAAVTILIAWWLWLRVLLRQKQQLELAVVRRTEDLEREKSELLRTREQMRHYAEHDGLTGLWNHRIIMERLRGEASRSHREKAPLSVILADIDHFKIINDTYGHQCGDLVLRRMGEILLQSVRTYDWVGRYGGEEFLVILPHTSLKHAQARADELRLAVEAMQLREGDADIRITISLGVASGLPSGSQDMIRAADAALYRAKDSGRNCVVATEIEMEATH